MAAALPASPLLGDLLRMLARRAGGSRQVQVQERPDALANIRFGEAIGHTMKELMTHWAASQRQHVH